MPQFRKQTANISLLRWTTERPSLVGINLICTRLSPWLCTFHLCDIEIMTHNISPVNVFFLRLCCEGDIEILTHYISPMNLFKNKLLLGCECGIEILPHDSSPDTSKLSLTHLNTQEKHNNIRIFHIFNRPGVVMKHCQIEVQTEYFWTSFSNHREIS